MSGSALLPLALLAGCAVAQVWSPLSPSGCDARTNSSCGNNPALGTTYNHTFTASDTALDPQLWNVTAGVQNIKFGSDGAELTIYKSGDSVTAESAFYIMFGQVEVIMKAATGQGIISTFDLFSDDLDEIDLEIMGGNNTFVESNWYGWGNTSQYNALYHPVNGPQESMHNYTFVWGKTELQWIIDGNLARSVPYDKPGRYPQTPSILKFGIWAGGDSTQPEGTVTWAGGKTDWSKGPFTMSIQSITVTDASTNTSSYVYGDQSGSYQSIQAVSGESAAYKVLNKQSVIQSARQNWNGLSKTAKIGIAAGVLGFLVAVTIAYTAICIVQRKKGRAEKAIADKEWNDHTNELMEYRTRMARGDFAVSHMGHGERF